MKIIVLVVVSCCKWLSGCERIEEDLTNIAPSVEHSVILFRRNDDVLTIRRTED